MHHDHRAAPPAGHPRPGRHRRARRALGTPVLATAAAVTLLTAATVAAVRSQEPAAAAEALPRTATRAVRVDDAAVLLAGRAAEQERASRDAARTAAVSARWAQMARANDAALAARRALAAEQARAAAERAAAARAEREQSWVSPMAGYRYTSGFKQRWGRLHAGIDLAGPVGTPLVAVADGTITYAGTMSGYGTVLDLVTKDGVLVRYGHLSALSVRAGEVVRKGQQVGASGNSGHSTGPHLHLEIHPKGTPAREDVVDPLPVLAARHVLVAGAPTTPTPESVAAAAALAARTAVSDATTPDPQG